MPLKTYLTIQQKLSFDSHIYMKHFKVSVYPFISFENIPKTVPSFSLAQWLLGQIAILAVVSIN